MPPTLKVFVSGHCPNCQEARRLAREIVASYLDLTVEVVNLDVTAAPQNPEVFAVPTYVLNDEVICLGNPKQSWLEQQIDALMGVATRSRRPAPRLSHLPDRSYHCRGGIPMPRKRTSIPTYRAQSRQQHIARKLGYLAEIDIFQDLSSEEMDWLADMTTMTTCPKGRVFYRPEETGEVLFLLKKGRVQLYRISAEGKKLVITTLSPGSIFGEMTLIGQRMHNSFAEAIEECTLCVMSQADLERVLLDKPQVALRMIEAIGQRLAEAEGQLEDIAFKSIPARLASLLLRLRREQGDTIYGFTHQNLAEMIGTYRETTTQTLNRFKVEGVLAIGRKRLTILDPVGLQRIAES